jgi:hypothetical protein
MLRNLPAKMCDWDGSEVALIEKNLLEKGGSTLQTAVTD